MRVEAESSWRLSVRAQVCEESSLPSLETIHWSTESGTNYRVREATTRQEDPDKHTSTVVHNTSGRP